METKNNKGGKEQMGFIMRIRAPAKLVEEVKTKFFIKNGRRKNHMKKQDNKYTGNYISIILTVIVLGILCMGKIKWKTEYASIKAIVMCIVILCICVSFFLQKLISRGNIWEYGLDFEHELREYKKIGKKSGSYKNYTEWKLHILHQFKLRIKDENFYHFLKRKLRTSKLYETCVGILIIPVEVASLQFINADILLENNCGNVAGGIFDILVIVIAMLVILIDQKKRIYFLEDFCEIVFPDIANPENTKMKYHDDDLKKE